MAELVETQVRLYESIVRLGINIKKDGTDKKTIEYFQRRMETLEGYWKEYEVNHNQLIRELSRSHSYFVEQEYEKTMKAVETTKAVINDQFQLFHGHRQPRTPSQELFQDAGPSNRDDKLLTKSSHGTNSKRDDLIKRQYGNFKAFLRTANNIQIGNISDKWEFEDALRTLQARWSAIDTLHWEIDTEGDGENETYSDMYDEYEQKYNNLKKALNIKMTSVAHREKSTPQLDIPLFNGNFNQWVSFKDLFSETIHNNPSLSNGQKMQHLKSKVRGEAEKLIQHLPISTENYSVCWEILTHRYDNKKMIFSSHMNILLGLPNIQQQSWQQIKRMHDTTVECLNAIKHLGVDIKTWDPIIIHLLGQKLDAETYTEYIGSLKNSKELPFLNEFLEFLEMKFTTLETARRKQDVQTKPTITFNHPQLSSNLRKNNYPLNRNYNNYVNPSYGNKAITKSMQVSNIKCPLCNHQHGIYNCKNYLLLNDEQKLKTANRLNLCINCLFSHNGNQCTSTLTCRKCSAPHNTILHDALTNSSKQYMPRQENIIGTSHASQNENAEILLATAIVMVKTNDGSYLKLRALVDQGSQISLVTERATQMLGLKRKRCKGVIFGVGQKENNCKGMITLTARSIYNDFTFETNALIMNDLIKSLPNKTFPEPTWSYIQNINLADPEFYNSRPVDILLGADIYATIIQGGIIKGENLQQPIAQQSQLGWLLCGKMNFNIMQCNVVLNNIEEITKFWEVEEINESSNLSKEDQDCIQFYKSTTKRNEDGRYEVRLPLKQDLKHKLGTSKTMAIAQFQNLERKFERQKALALQYKTFMEEYSDLKHMIPEKQLTKTLECYLPHHGVLREHSTTTKLRVVFNASAQTSTKWSLNDIMQTGPNLQKNLQSLLLQWRQFPYAFTADLEKMYRQIAVENSDQQLQKIIWRQSPDDPIQTYQLTTVTYGTKAAPFLAMMTLRQLASDERYRYPEAAVVLEESFYMDDLLHGSYTIEQGKHLISELILLLKSGGFNLRKWSSNKIEILEEQTEYNEHTLIQFKTEDMSKTLGLFWDTKNDQFTFSCNFSKETSKLTKRFLLSEISKLFDPLGWLTPLSTKLKLLFQQLWINNLHWDDKVSDDIRNNWLKIIKDIDAIKTCVIPRWVLCDENDVIELHGFCDASVDAYACVVYVRSKKHNKTILLAARSKLVPHKKAITLPRAELCGAYLLSQLINKIKQSFQAKTEVYCWCDSMVVLGWLHGDSTRWKPFVANRINFIKPIIPPEAWRYVKSNENPADSASRGLTPYQLQKHPLWWTGPEWLGTFKQESVKNQSSYFTNEEIKSNKLVNFIQHHNNIIDDLLQLHNSFIKIVRVLAWLLRTLTPVLQRKQLPKYLTLQELRKAKVKIIKYLQLKEFGSDIAKLKTDGHVLNSSKLLNLNPYIDQEGLLRVGGRLRRANINIEMKHPKIIPNKSRLAELLIQEAHELTFHGGPRLTLTTLRQQYWITSGYSTTKAQLRNCVTCRKYDSKKQSQIMGDLPAARINQAAPFYHTGVDYTGFFDIKANKGRGVRTLKGYVAVFVCMVTKAVHLELVSDLTSSAFIAALKRMAARKGAPVHLYSDQGTNFIGANRMIQEEYELLQQLFEGSVPAEVVDMNIEWHFNAPSWPSAGGLWERAVQSLKRHLKRVIGEQKLTFEEFTTILAQLEACLNSRPLCAVTENIEDLDYLTPAHFLQGRAGLTILETANDTRTTWHLTNNIFKQIWKQWKAEYLNQLQTREKWMKPKSNLKVGDLVMVHEDNVPAGKWLMGRVINLYPGIDGYVRVVDLKTRNGILKRPVIKLSKLPITSSEEPSKTNNSNTSQSERSTDTTKQRRRNTPLGKLHNIVMALTFFMTLVGNASGSLNITKLSENQSLYFDPISQIYLIKDSWTMVVYYNMSPYWEGIQAFNKLTTYLDKTCSILNNYECNTIVDQLMHEYNELYYYNELLITQKHDARSRQRRGLINGVGYLANSLFGVLDERFAEMYTRDIEQIRHNEHHMVNLLKNQTSLVESEYNILKRTEIIMKKQHKIINKHLNNLDRFTNRLQQEISNLSILQEFTMTSLTATNLLHNLKGSQDLLLDLLSNVHHGQFNLHLLTPEQLQRELNIISEHLPDDIKLPVSRHNIIKLFSLLNIQTRITKNYFLFKISIPLISRDSYQLFKVLSVPHTRGNNMIELETTSQYIATNLGRDLVIFTTIEELSRCNQLTEAYYCNLKPPTFHISSINSLCTIDRNTKCKVKQSTCENKIMPLTNPSRYLFHFCNESTVQAICRDQIQTERLNTTGIISVTPGCSLKGSNYYLTIPKPTNNDVEITNDIYIPAVDQLNHIVYNSMQLSGLPNESDHSGLEFSLELLHKHIEEVKQRQTVVEESLTPHDIHHYVVSYMLVGAGALAGGVWLLCRVRRRREQRARISADLELQPTSSSASEVNISAGNSARSNTADRQPSARHIYAKINKTVVCDKKCSPIPRKPLTFETLK